MGSLGNTVNSVRAAERAHGWISNSEALGFQGLMVTWPAVLPLYFSRSRIEEGRDGPGILKSPEFPQPGQSVTEGSPEGFH